jgi:hypothetical protein
MGEFKYALWDIITFTAEGDYILDDIKPRLAKLANQKLWGPGQTRISPGQM